MSVCLLAIDRRRLWIAPLCHRFGRREISTWRSDSLTGRLLKAIPPPSSTYLLNDCTGGFFRSGVTLLIIVLERGRKNRQRKLQSPSRLAASTLCRVAAGGTFPRAVLARDRPCLSEVALGPALAFHASPPSAFVDIDQLSRRQGSCDKDPNGNFGSIGK